MATVYESANAKAQVTRDSALGRMAGGTDGGKDLTLKSASSTYSVFNDPTGNGAANRSFLNSRLWHGVPQLTEEQMMLTPIFMHLLKTLKLLSKDAVYPTLVLRDSLLILLIRKMVQLVRFRTLSMLRRNRVISSLSSMSLQVFL